MYVDAGSSGCCRAHSRSTAAIEASVTAIGIPPLKDLEPRTRTRRALVMQEINRGHVVLGPKTQECNTRVKRRARSRQRHCWNFGLLCGSLLEVSTPQWRRSHRTGQLDKSHNSQYLIALRTIVRGRDAARRFRRLSVRPRRPARPRHRLWGSWAACETSTKEA